MKSLIILDFISSNSCLNGGKCKDEQFAFICQCTKGYQGKRCNLKVIKKLVEPNDMQNEMHKISFILQIDFCASNPCEDGYR